MAVSKTGRTQTSAKERTEQNHRLIEEESLAAGRRLTLAQAREHRKRATALDDHLVPDKIVDFPADALEPVGKVLGKVLDVKMTRGYLNIVIQTGSEFAHVASDALLMSNHPLLVTLETVYADLNKGDNDDHYQA